MSTKGLMADKRVANVELHPQTGKAFKITLAEGWTYEGSSGPFELKNVDHGHKIVKAAVNPNAPGKAARAPRKATQPSGPPSDPSQPYAPPEPPPTELRKIKRRDDVEAWVYRPMLSDGTREVTGWMRFTDKPTCNLKARARDLLKANMKALGGDPEAADVTCPRWTAEMEREARKANTAGCPWPSLFRPGQTTANDAPFTPGDGQ